MDSHHIGKKGLDKIHQPEEFELNIFGLFKLKAKNLSPTVLKLVIVLLLLMMAFVITIILCWPQTAKLVSVVVPLKNLRNVIKYLHWPSKS